MGLSIYLLYMCVGRRGEGGGLETYLGCPGCGEPGLDVCAEEAREPGAGVREVLVGLGEMMLLD
jgi:hypothetical protein